MSKPGASLFYFGFYVLFVGLLFIIVPGWVVSVASLPAIPAGWARVVGFLAAIIGICDIICGKQNSRPMISASVYIRLAFAIGIVLLVLSRQMPPSIIVFSAVDAAGAIWTAIELRKENAVR